MRESITVNLTLYVVLNILFVGLIGVAYIPADIQAGYTHHHRSVYNIAHHKAYYPPCKSALKSEKLAKVGTQIFFVRKIANPLIIGLIPITQVHK